MNFVNDVMRHLYREIILYFVIGIPLQIVGMIALFVVLKTKARKEKK